jgi:hypothetical protein
MPSWAIYGNERRRGIHDPPAVVNLLTQPNDFSHADWTEENLTATAADTIVEDATTNFHTINQSLSKDAAEITYNLSVEAKDNGGRERIAVQLDDGSANGRYAVFDVQNGLADGTAVTGFGTTFSGGTKNIVDATGGWWRLELNGIVSGSEATLRAVFALDGATGTSPNALSYAGDGAQGMQLRAALLVEA